MRYKVTLKSSDETANGWFVHYFRWESLDAPAPDMHLIQGWTASEGAFTASIDVQDGEYGLACHVALSGRSVELTLEPEPEIVWPKKATWPFKVKVPSGASQILKTLYFKAENQE